MATCKVVYHRFFSEEVIQQVMETKAKLISSNRDDDYVIDVVHVGNDEPLIKITKLPRKKHDDVGFRNQLP